MKRLVCLVAILATWNPGAAVAQRALRPAWLFTDHAVLQRGAEVPIWGTAEPGEAVTVTLLTADSQVVASANGTTDAKGRWIVRLSSLRAGGPFSLVLRGARTIVLRDILVGDVWICSGQSNMEWSITQSDNPEEAIANSNIPGLRLLTVPREGSNAPLSEIRQYARWVQSGPTTVPEFSAVAFNFGRQLRKALDVPIGLIHTSLGGSSAEQWTPEPVLRAMPSAEPALARYDSSAAKFSVQLAEYQRKLEEWYAASVVSEREGQPIAPPPPFPTDPRTALWYPSRLYNGMLAPLRPYAFTGVIWYQGESNTGRAYQYRELLPAMIRGWRAAWNQGDFPFLIVQLPNITSRAPAEPDSGSSWAELRESQYLTTRSTPMTGLAVTIDVGGDLHPGDKVTVGRRLALVARAIAYRETGLVYTGPQYRSMTIDKGVVRLSFDHVGGGLVARDGKLVGFAVAGPDRKFVWAEARIEGTEVVISSPLVADPRAVRYAWADDPPISLFNAEGFPAMPFRTDDWPGKTQRNK